MPPHAEARTIKFKQAAFVYLHVAILYEAAAYAMWRRNLLPGTSLGPAWLWFLLGAAVGLLVFFGLLRWQNVWFAGVIWAVHGLRLPTLIRGAFFADASAIIAPGFYQMAIVVVMINLWMLARAVWDL